jgi:hypothetical protein
MAGGMTTPLPEPTTAYIASRQHTVLTGGLATVEIERLLQKSPETNLAWAGLINKRAYEHYIAGGAADEYDHIEFSELSYLARRT